MKLSWKLFQKKEIRKIQYLVLFMMLNLVEWLKATQTGDVWKVAVNISGIIVLLLVMSAYSRKELICRFSKSIALGCMVAMAAVYGYWYLHQGSFLVWQYLTAIINVGLIAIVMWALYRRYRRGELRKPKLDLTGILWLVLSALMILSVSGRLWPVWYLLIYGMFYLTEYSTEDKEALTSGMVEGTILSFFFMQAYAFGFRPYDEVRYKGPLSNCNMTALYYLIVYCMVLVKLHWLHLEKASGWIKSFFLLLAGVLLGFQFMTLCRTAWLSAIAVTFVYGIWIMMRLWRDKLIVLLGKAVLLGVVTLAAFLPVFYSARWLPTILHHPIWYEGEWSGEKIHSFDPANSEKYVTLGEFLETAIGRFALIFTGTVEPEQTVDLKPQETKAPIDVTQTVIIEENSKKPAAKEQSNDTQQEIITAATDNLPILTGKREYTSSEIRAAIFKAYWNDLNLWGHSEKEGYYQITKDYKCWHAQNLWLQIAYYFGIPAGMIAIILTIVLIVFYLKRGWQSRLDARYGVLPLLIVVLYFSFGIMEVVWNPGQLVFCLVFLVQHPGIVRNSERE